MGLRFYVSMLACCAVVFMSGCESPPGTEYSYYFIPPADAEVEPTAMTIRVAPAAVGTQPMSNGLYPGILFVHGGSWESGHMKDMYDDVNAATARGYVAATLNYRLSLPSDFSVFGVWPAPLEDVKCAIRWMRANAGSVEKGWNLDPDKIAVVGLSAGGHLALMAGETSGLMMGGEPVFEAENCHHEGAAAETSEVAAVATMSGIGDLNQLWERDEFNGRNGLLIQKVEQLMGAGVDLGGEGPHAVVSELNPIEYVSAEGPPVMMVHPENDGVISTKAEARYPDQDQEPTLGYHESVLSLGRSSVFVMPNRGAHYTQTGIKAYAHSQIFAWMDRHLKGLEVQLDCGDEASCSVVLPEPQAEALNNTGVEFGVE